MRRRMWWRGSCRAVGRRWWTGVMYRGGVKKKQTKWKDRGNEGKQSKNFKQSCVRRIGVTEEK